MSALSSHSPRSTVPSDDAATPSDPGGPDPFAAALSRLTAGLRDRDAGPVTRRGARLLTRGLSVAAGGRALVEGVDFLARPGELVAVLGASGSGKSTLLRALVGLVEPTAGRVLVDDAAASSAGLQRDIGHVPQEQVLHPELTPRATLAYAAQLRLPTCSHAERQRRVHRALTTLGIEGCAGRPVRQLSGGQRKRVSIGLELLTDPRAVVLDEPASGLDPSLRHRLLETLRTLAAQGCTVVVASHHLEALDLFDRVAVLDGGRLAFAGPPRDLRERLGERDLVHLYEELQAGPASAPERRPAAPPAPPSRPGGLGPRAALRQLGVLTARHLEVLQRDRRSTALRVLQAPLVGLLVAAAGAGPAVTVFMLVLSALWLGTSTGAREVVKEHALRRRERRWGVRPLPYLGAKVLVLGGLAAAQCALLLGVVASLHALPAALLGLFGALAAAAAVGILCGLAISAVVERSDRASALIPLALIPQVLLGGVLVHQGDLAEDLSRAMPSRWAYDLAVRQSLDAGPGSGPRLVTAEEHGARRRALEALEARGRAELRALAETARDRTARASDDAAAAGEALADLRAERDRLLELARTVDDDLDGFAGDARELRSLARRAERLRNPSEPRDGGSDARSEDGRERVRRALRAFRDRLERGQALLDELATLEGQADAHLEQLEGLRRQARRVRESAARLDAIERRTDALGRDRAAAPSARALGDDLARLADRLAEADERRPRVRRPLAEGRVVHLLPEGSARADALALAGFGLGFGLLALAALERR